MRESNPVVQEAIRVAMQRLSKHGKVNVTKKHILKVLFLAKARLSDDNRVKRDLAYYWYMEGPYSEVVYANFDRMISSGLVLKTHATKAYRLAPERAMKPISSSDDLEESRREIGRVAKEFPNVHDAVKRAYEAAPFKWYYTYNLKFRPKFESHCKDVLAGRESRHSTQDVGVAGRRRAGLSDNTGVHGAPDDLHGFCKGVERIHTAGFVPCLRMC